MRYKVSILIQCQCYCIFILILFHNPLSLTLQINPSILHRHDAATTITSTARTRIVVTGGGGNPLSTMAIGTKRERSRKPELKRQCLWHSIFTCYCVQDANHHNSISDDLSFLLPTRTSNNKNNVQRIHGVSIPSFTTNNTTTSTISDGEYEQRFIDEYFMGLALEEAKEAGCIHDEVPIGAIVVIPAFVTTRNCNPIANDKQLSVSDQNYTTTTTTRYFEVLSTGQNQIETNYDASAHAELQALRYASRNIQNWRLLNATLYTTLEPCPMCLSAAQAFRVARIVYGAPDLRLGAVETYMKLLDYPHPFHGSGAMEVVGGVRSDEARMLLVDFFQQRRRKKEEKTREEESRL
mmetsp:Transcript_12109/g.22661  ORF Transcript_12109/g.22661 Transcript_12109/m.22661 type:complete len:352 (+) Transcript_12109:18-1073(+)